MSIDQVQLITPNSQSPTSSASSTSSSQIDGSQGSDSVTLGQECARQRRRRACRFAKCYFRNPSQNHINNVHTQMMVILPLADVAVRIYREAPSMKFECICGTSFVDASLILKHASDGPTKCRAVQLAEKVRQSEGEEADRAQAQLDAEFGKGIFDFSDDSSSSDHNPDEDDVMGSDQSDGDDNGSHDDDNQDDTDMGSEDDQGEEEDYESNEEGLDTDPRH